MAETTWSDLVELSLQRANTTASSRPSGCQPLRLNQEPEMNWLKKKPRRIAQIEKPLREMIGKLTKGELPWPLLMLGPAGSGKTCAGLCEVFIQAQQGRLTMPVNGRLVYPENLWAELAGTALVVLDELGAREKVTEFHYDTMKRLLDEREGRPLICVSNLNIGQLGRIYDDRVASRLAAGTAVALDGTDRRLIG